MYVDLTATTAAAFDRAIGDDRTQAELKRARSAKSRASNGGEALFSCRNGGDGEGACDNSGGARCEESAF